MHSHRFCLILSQNYLAFLSSKSMNFFNRIDLWWFVLFITCSMNITLICILIESSYFSFTGSWLLNRRNHGQTIHPTEKSFSMNLLQMSCVITWTITWTWSFLTSEVSEAIRGQKHHISAHILALLFNFRFIPQRQFYLPKIHLEMRSVMTFSLHWASISRILVL